MAEVVDSIIAELIVRDNGYVANFDKATAAHERFTKSMPKVAGGLDLSGADAQKYADRHKKAANDVAGAAEASAGRVSRAAKTKSAAEIAAAAEVKAAAKATADAQRAAAKAASDAVKAAEREKQAALKATQREQEKAAAAALKAAEVEKAAAAAAVAAIEREAATRLRLAAVAERAVTGAGVKPGSGRNLGITSANEPSGQRTIPLGVLNGATTPEVAAEAEINHLMADRFDLAAKAKVAEGGVKRELQDQVEWLRRISAYKAAGLTESEAVLRAETETLAVEKLRAEQTEKQSLSGAARFAEGAGLGRSGGGKAAIAGIAVAAAVAAGVAATSQAIDFAKALDTESEALGITTRSLQVYQAAADELGVTHQQLSSGLGQLSANLGKAQDGAVEQGKVFKALGVDIGSARDGFKSAGEILPTLIDRLSSIENPAQRAAVETALFGEEGRRLDGLLSGGIDKVNNLADAMDRAGSVLSADDIRALKEASVELARVENLLEVDLSRIVAGNIDAIEGLAKAFGFLADHIGGAIQQASVWGRAGSSSFGGWGRYSALPIVGGAVGFGYGLVGGMQENNRPPTKGGLQIMAARQAAEIKESVQGGNVDRDLLGKLNAPKGSKGRKGRAQATPEQKDDDFNARQEQLRAELLKSTASLTEAADDRAAAALEQLSAEHAAFEKQIVDDKKLTDARRDVLRVAEQKALDSKKEKIEQDRLHQIADENFQFADQEMAAKEQALQAQIDLTTSIGERAKLEKQLLELEKQRELAGLNHDIDVGTPQQAALALEKEKSVDPNYAAKQKLLDKKNQGPLADYIDTLPKSVDDINRAFQNAEVQGLRSFTDGLSTAIDKFLHLHGIAGQFLSDLIKIGIEREITLPIANALFGAQGGAASNGGGPGGLIGSLANALGSILGGGGSGGATGGWASGGSGVIGGHPGIDQNTLSLNGVPIRKVGRGELLTVTPNVVATNMRVNNSPPQITVLAPRQYDLSNSLIDRETLAQMNAENRDFAAQLAKAGIEQSVRISASQAPGVISRYQQEKG